MRDILQLRYLRSNVAHKQLARTSLIARRPMLLHIQNKKYLSWNQTKKTRTYTYADFFKIWLCPNFSRCPKNLSCPNFGEGHIRLCEKIRRLQKYSDVVSQNLNLYYPKKKPCPLFEPHNVSKIAAIGLLETNIYRE